jgi:E3 ubiquitin-protein ligase HERC2
MNQDKFVTNPSATQPLHMLLFEFVGKLFGIALRSGNLLNLNLAPVVWKCICGEPISLQDITDIDVLAFKALEDVSKFAADSSIDRDMLEDILCLNFIITGSDGKEIELVPGGSSISVTSTNLDEYIRLSQEFRIAEFSPQCDAIKRGMATVVPYPLLSLFTGAELEALVCGKPIVDVDLLRRMTIYDGCSENDPHIVFFWNVFSSFSELEKSQFLKFVWGRSRLPLKESEFESKFKLTGMFKSRGNPDVYLPVSHTCFFSLELPQYSSESVMRQRLLYAITHCTSIDADATTAARAAASIISSEDQDE